jgi:predicted Zn-dependent protease
MKLSIARFSRQQEFEADQIGIKAIAKAGYDPYAAARFLDSLGRWSALRASMIGAGSPDTPDMMATHPSTPERVAQAIVEARQIGAPGIGDTARDAYLGAIDGIAFGDDPSQGLVLGRRFLHPKLGFAFEAPDGFTLENQRAALIAVADAGAEALRLDSIEASESTSLENALASGWIDGVKTSSIEPVSGADLPMAVAVAQGEQWSFRLGAVRLGGRIFRLIFAAHALTPAVDASFRASIQSFHRLKPEEAAVARPMRVQVVAAGPGETSDSLARRMAVTDRALDQFLVLNGLESGAPTPIGQRFKIVSP